MSFIVDKQTLGDLNLLGKYRSDSIFHIYDCAVTHGGRQMMEDMFLNPLSDAKLIARRSASFGFFMQHPMEWPFGNEDIEAAEYCLSTPAYGQRWSNAMWLFRRKAMLYIASDRMYESLRDGVAKVIEVLGKLRTFCRTCEEHEGASLPLLGEIRDILSLPVFQRLEEMGRSIRTVSFWQLERLYYQFRVSYSRQLTFLMRAIYELDIYLHVSRLAVERGFSIASVTTGGDTVVEGLFHPSVRGARPNDIRFDKAHNVVFLTGANMSGKSTFMKSFGVAVYLAHMGFPVPAARMQLPVQDGLFTSINVSDNLDKGYSHYYAEVLRVKSVAGQVSAGKRLVIIFDELFKGTNVKDAYDATKAVIRAFAEHHSCLFVVSTHIIEVCDDLQKECDNFVYMYFPTYLENGMPRYTYKLVPGVTSDRQGMMILRNEHILELIRHENG